MLPYETCCKLKAAGYPQPVDEHGQAKGQYHGSFVAGPECACPNSDELIAAIQQRWPDANCSVWRQKLLYRQNGEYRAGVTWNQELALDEPMGPYADGDTPAAALAALYLALAGGE